MPSTHESGEGRGHYRRRRRRLLYAVRAIEKVKVAMTINVAALTSSARHLKPRSVRSWTMPAWTARSSSVAFGAKGRELRFDAQKGDYCDL
jgi:hypothetical protein